MKLLFEALFMVFIFFVVVSTVALLFGVIGLVITRRFKKPEE